MNNMRKLMEASDIQYPDYAQQTLDELIADIQQLEEDTLRVYQEAASEESRARPDYTQMLLNELRETVKQITEISRKYD